MKEGILTEQLAFVAAESDRDEAVILAQAVREGVRLLYQDALIEAYLLGRVPREKVFIEIGPELLEAVEVQRDALLHDVEWGLMNG